MHFFKRGKDFAGHGRCSMDLLGDQAHHFGGFADWVGLWTFQLVIFDRPDWHNVFVFCGVRKGFFDQTHTGNAIDHRMVHFKIHGKAIVFDAFDNMAFP